MTRHGTHLAVHAVRAARAWACLPVLWLALAVMPRMMRMAALDAIAAGMAAAEQRLRSEMITEQAARHIQPLIDDIRRDQR